MHRASPTIPERALDAFGSSQARPRVIRAYNPSTGFVDVAGHPLLTREEVARLRAEGYGMIDVKWRWRRHRLSVLPGGDWAV